MVFRHAPRGKRRSNPARTRFRSTPWQNPYVERLIGTIRRQCLDHMIVFGEAHLRRIRYAAYYNESRIHRSLDKDAPFHRATERFGVITSQPVLGGLHPRTGLAMLPYIAGSHPLAEKFVRCHFGDSFRHLPFVHGDCLAN